MTNYDLNKFKGIFTALITPMHADGAIDIASLKNLVKHQISLGVKGFYVGGSTGEGFILTAEERMQVLEEVVNANAGQLTIISHVGCISTSESIRLAKHAEKIGVDAISAVVPFYYKLSMKEIQEHYEAIMASTELPMIIYHFPGATGVNLTMDFYETMGKHPNCLGVKFTSLNLFEMQQIRSICGENFLIFNGHDEIYAGGALSGADGAIGSTFNIMASLFVELFDYAGKADWQSVKNLQAKANEIIAELIKYDVLSYEKYVLFLQGIIKCPYIRQPLKQLTTEEQQKIKLFYDQNEVLQSNSLIKS
ncbi:N-acetylneuraminate lyase [Paenibacillus agaridevorans]|uniref:N-acetylneuraminate lyase n=1 Tax=Paenibacillus agaridevorans TaxID=171404 RepID=UPI001BE48DF9|nr:N-acetylneuraminate lyase [Paenibacillus agaridevorans]